VAEHVKLLVPELGDFADVEIIEVLVSVGDTVAVEDPLVTLETDKATMDVPASAAGTIISIAVDVGGKVNSGDLVATIEASDEAQAAAAQTPANEASAPDATVVIGPEEQEKILAEVAQQAPAEPAPETVRDPLPETTHFAQLVVLGSGPGGYTAAFRAADLGLNVILVERYPVIGGVCLNVGCIPSKALLHAAKVIDEAEAMAEHGVKFGKPEIDADGLRAWKNKVVGRLTGGLTQLAKQRKVQIIQATAKFGSSRHLVLDNGETIGFDKCVIAAGSQPAMIPGLPDDPRIVDSTGALELEPIPERLLVVGGGIIGLEMACVYSALGSAVSVVELTDSLMPGTDPDLVRPFRKIIDQRYEKIMLGTKVAGMQATSTGMQTNVAHIFAIGDLAGGPMLAHKATHEAKVAAEVAAGEKSAFDARTIPSVAYTDPEVAWVGLTETEAKAQGASFEKTKIPWAASGRALAIGRDEGFTKLLFDKSSGRVLGGGIVGPNAGDLIAEIGLAVEMGADATDVGLTIHPHPTLSETVAFAAEAFDGTLTDLYLPKKR
jgi:dihydrolipoamide dehydrogenase